MKILLLHQYFLEKEDGGGSRFNQMTRQWEEMGHHTSVLAGMVHYATGKKPERYRGKLTHVSYYSENVKVIRCYVSGGYNKNFLGRLLGYFSFVLSGIYAGIFVARGKFDLILATSPPLFIGITALVLALLKRVPIVFEVRDLWPESAIDTGVIRNRLLVKISYWFEKYIYRKSVLINALTPAFRTTLIQRKGVPPDKVIMIPNAADFMLAESVLADFDSDHFRMDLGLSDQTVITYVGAHGVANHLIQVIDVAERVRDIDVTFLLIGSGMEKDMLMREAEQRQVDNVKFIDPVPKSEIFKYISASDFGASVLKRVDTFKTIYSNKTFDYMACRKPILMVIDGISRDLVEEAKCGIYIEPENIEMFESQVRKAHAMTEPERDRLGGNGYVYAREHFDRTVLAQKYVDCLAKAVKSS